jgi:cytochrome c peroxidase
MRQNAGRRAVQDVHRLSGTRLAALLALAVTLAVTLLWTGGVAAVGNDPNLQPIPDATGTFQTYSTNGSIDTTNPFFQSLGTNGRTCATCHDLHDGWTITPADVQARFNATGGLDPLFRPNDGSNSPNADVSTVDARRAAYSMLLTKGLIRITLSPPQDAQFAVTAVDDPYAFAAPDHLSLFRRPLPTTNLPFLSAVMWDGRETVQPITNSNPQALPTDLMHQAMDATLGHAQAAITPTTQQLQQIASFQTGLFSAQSSDNAAGQLDAQGATGGPLNLSNQAFHIGINDPLGLDPTGTPFEPDSLTVFDAWEKLKSSTADPSAAARKAVARGDEIFDTKPISITGVAGLNDVLGRPVIVGTCTTCHNTPNVGNHSVVAFLNIGTADYPARPGLDAQGLPVYTLQCTATDALMRTTDPGRAMITGTCADISTFKVPILRALAARAPYFHNGSAATLDDVATFYDNRFNMGLTPQEKADLVAFLRSL